MQESAVKQPWHIGFPAMVGLASVALLVGVFGLWGIFTEIAGAIVASGRVEVRSNRQVVEHPDGGVVGKFEVKDGDQVKAGDLLVQIDDTFLTSEMAIVENQLYEVMARIARLTAERDGRDALDAQDELIKEAQRVPEIDAVLEGQRRLFQARRDTIATEKQMLEKSIHQTRNQITGTEAQLKALREQTELIKAEIADQVTLKDKGLSRESQVKALKREESRLAGEIGQLEAEAARLANQVTQAEVESLRLDTTRRQEAIKELRDSSAQQAELQERRLSLREQLARMDIRAPMDGIVYDSKIFTVGSVIRPANPIMYIIPQDEPLIITVQVPTNHVDQLYIGQPVSLHFSAFSQRETPVIMGKVTSISADAFVDEATRIAFYRVKIEPDPGQMELLNDKELVPGMPVEAFIKTEDRTPLSYLTKPLTDYFTRAFRE